MLEGQAAQAIQGLTLSESNYQLAVEILHERFGKTQQIISAHMDELLKLPTCTWDKPGQLRIIYDKIKINVRGLESLGVKAEQYGSFLIPVIMSRLPAEVRLHVARVSTKDVWEINELLKVIQAEVEAREMSDTIKIQEKKGLKQLLHPREDFPQELLTHCLQGQVMDQEFVVRFALVNVIHLHVKKSRNFRNERTFLGGINVFCVCQWVIVQTSVPGRKSVEFVTGQIIISQFVK